MANAFRLGSGTSQGCLLSPFLLNIVLGVLASAVKQESKKHTNRKEIKLSLFADYIII